MNTVIKSFFLPLICAVGILAAPTPFSVVHAQQDSGIKSAMKWFCDDRAGYLESYQIAAVRIEEKYKHDDVRYGEEHEKERVASIKFHEGIMGDTFTNVITACIHHWAR